jgi:hypothetical protein
MAARAARAPRLWIGWVLVVTAVGLAIIAWRVRTPAGQAEPVQQSPAVVAASPAASVAPPSGSAAQRPGPSSAIETLRARAQAKAARAQSRQQYWVDGFAAQKIDPQWAGKQQQALLAMTRTGDFASDPAKPRDLAIDCKSSLCRLQASFASAAQAQDWTELVTLHSGGRFTGGATQISMRKDGTAGVMIIVQPR